MLNAVNQVEDKLYCDSYYYSCVPRTCFSFLPRVRGRSESRWWLR